jgi:phospholipase C
MSTKKIVLAIVGTTFGLVASFDPAAAQEGLAKIKTIVVIYGENRSFDHMYGFFPDANGIANATNEQKTQLDHDGKPLPQLTIFGGDGKPDPRFPRVANGPFQINSPAMKMPPDKIAPNPIHAFYHHQEQINGGRNNMFAAMANVGGWTMGYYDTSRLRLWQWAKEFTLADNFFLGAFGGSYLNHFWLVCACTPEHKDAPERMRAQLDANGKLTKKPDSPSANEGAVQVYSSAGGQVSPDGYSVNLSQPAFQPSGIPPAPGGDLNFADPKGTKTGGEPVPPQTIKTVGDTLSAKSVSWAWYAGSWNAAVADGRRPAEEKRKVIYNREPDSPNFQPHHHPFNYFARFAPGTADRATYLKDGEDFLKAIDSGSLPQVTFYKPTGRLNQHPGSSDLATGDSHIADLLEHLRISPQWNEMAVIVTYDENGGFWDHVPPPTGPGWGDRFGPGTRVPTLIISPFAKRGHIDKTSYDTTSIIKLITRRFELEPLAGVRANAGDMTAAFDFTQQP